MKYRVSVIVACAMLVVACASNKTLQAVGGSRADGTVKLAFEYGAFQKPRVDLVAAQQTAKARCAVWGYKDAEAFGGQMSQCTASNGYGCMRTMVTVEYQCTGANTPN